MRILTRLRTDANVLKDRRGATAIEYAMVASLISIAAIAGYSNLGGKVETGFNNVDQSLTKAL